MNAAEIANLLGWCTLLNCGLLIFSSLMLVVFLKPVSQLHARLFDLDPTELKMSYFRFLANYKVLIIVFNLVPYLALRIMS